MSRLIKPSAVDNRLVKMMLNEYTDPADWWGFLFFDIVIFASLTVGLSFISLWFLLFLVPPVLHIGATVSLYKNSKELFTYYHYDNEYSLYYLGLKEYRSLYESDAKTDSHVLLSNIWKHEISLHNSGKRHTKKSCKACGERLDLIKKLAKMQSTPGTDSEDIETLTAKIEQIEIMQGIVKELS